MRTIEFELERTIQAPIDQVFARLVDINGHNDWVAKKGSILQHTRQTSPGEPAVGTTYVDQTSQGQVQGEIVGLEAPTSVVYHWWATSRSGKLTMEGWPGYSLEAMGASGTLLRHHATLKTYGLYRLAAPILTRIALRERTATVDALKASFEAGQGSARG
ncbi:MAG: SRPBCC family protein [Propionicimonas sp.]